MTSKPRAAMSGSRAMQSSNVPCRPGMRPWLRGTISYHAPARARGRSAWRGKARLRLRSFWNAVRARSEEHTSELQSLRHLVCRLLLESDAAHRCYHSFPTRRSSDLAESGDVRQPRDAVVERAVSAGDAALAARDHLVPRASTRPRAVGMEGKGPASLEVVLECGARERQCFVGQERATIRLIDSRERGRDIA